MSRNGAGVYTPPATAFPAVALTLIESTKFNDIITDMAAALTGSVAADGQTTITADIPMSTHKLTGLGAGSGAGHSVEYAQMNSAIAAFSKKVVDSITALKALDKTAITKAFVTGYYAKGDGGGGSYYYDAADTTTADNGGTVIVATDGGRWKLSNTPIISVKQFGAKGDGVTNDTSTIQNTINYIKDLGKGEIYIPAGTYLVSSALVLTGVNNAVFAGAGNDATIISTNSATADVFYDAGASWWRTFRDFSIASSVTKSAGSHFNLTGEKRGLFDRIRLTGHFNGFNFAGFEQTELRSCSVTKPSGAGTAIICGAAGSAGQGANLLINACFLRGQDDVTQTNTLGNYGIAIYDVDAVWGLNTDVGAFLQSDVLIAPNTRSANHYFTQCFFDATKSADCVTIQGAGTKQQLNFTACWFASAGKLTGGNAEACGVRCYNAGTYQDIIFSGCRFYNNSGSGMLSAVTNFDAALSGCDFYANGASAATNKYGLFWAPAAAGSIGPNASGCRFAGNTPNDIRFEANSRNYAVVGSHVENGISNAGSGGMLSKNPGYNPVTSTPTVTASPYSYTNTTGDTQTIAIVGGTVSSVTFNGVPVASSSNTSVSLPNDNTLTVTYTVAPAVYAVGV